MTLNQFGMVFPSYSHAYITGDICKSLYSDMANHKSRCSVDAVENVAQNAVKMINELKAARCKSISAEDWWSYKESAD